MQPHVFSRALLVFPKCAIIFMCLNTASHYRYKRQERCPRLGIWQTWMLKSIIRQKLSDCTNGS